MPQLSWKIALYCVNTENEFRPWVYVLWATFDVVSRCIKSASFLKGCQPRRQKVASEFITFSRSYSSKKNLPAKPG